MIFNFFKKDQRNILKFHRYNFKVESMSKNDSIQIKKKLGISAESIEADRSRYLKLDTQWLT